MTIYTLLNEVLEIKTFLKGDLLSLQSQYSPSNSRYRKYYEPRVSRFS